jgi:hypothetical protein
MNMRPVITRGLSVAVIVIALSLGGVSVAHATDTLACQAEIDALIAKTQDTTFVGQNAAKDEAALVQKLLEARQKLDEGKLDDAILKVQNYIDKVLALALGEEINTDPAAGTTAEELVAGALAIIACIQTIGQ